MTLSEPSRPTSILLIEPNGGLASKLQELLIGYFHTALDLGTARSFREGMTHLCTHRVALVLMALTFPDYKGLDAVRAVRMTVPGTALIALGAVPNEMQLLDAIRAGAHEILSVATLSVQELRLTIERAMVRAEQPGMIARSMSPVQPAEPSAALPKLVHDLNNAITSINGFADILLTRLPIDEPARTSAEQIRKAGTRATALVRALTPQPASSPSVLTPDPTVTTQAA